MRSAAALFAAFLLAGCPSADPPWQVRHAEGSAWLLSVGALSGKVLAVGGKPGASPTQPGSGVILSFPDDGSAPQRLASSQPGMLWWVHSLGAATAWLCGESGSIVRYSEQSGAPMLQSIPTPTGATLYGIWAFSDDDVWAVGGTEGGPGVILHGGLSGFTADSTAPSVPILFKVFASDPSHLFIVGHAGTLLRRTGTAWTLDPYPSAAPDRLLTVWGTSATEVYAVGGLGSGRLLRFDGQSWQLDDATAGFGPLAGLFADSESVLIAGQRGFLASRRSQGQSGAFTVSEAVTDLDLHGALSRPGVSYAVGGNLSEFGLFPPRGTLLQKGAPSP